MKKTLLTLATAIACYSSYAQTNVFPSSGNVGIGTTTPANQLQVGSVGGTGYGGNAIAIGDGTNVVALHYGVTGYLVANGNLAIGGNTNTSQLFLASGGNVGVGTTSPFGILQVHASINKNLLVRANAALADGISLYSVNDANTNTGGMEFGASQYLFAGGNVGIGTTSPNGKLDVNGAILLPGSSTNTMSRPPVGATRIAGEIAGYSVVGLAADDGFLRLSAGGGTNSTIKSFIDLSGYSTIPDMEENITLGTLGTERVRITADGNVAIGTSNPQGYKLAVNGSAIATSMTVKLNSGWPDYVFKPKYHLPSLTEVKTYIDLNHHLPDMPSEGDVAKDGLNLGEMNKLLTKKVEELTLYLIEQQKINQTDKTQLQSQQDQINQLKKELDAITQTLNKN